MNTSSKAKGIVAVMATMVLAACAAAPLPATSPAQAGSRTMVLSGSRWTVAAVADEAGVLERTPAGIVVDLGFDADGARVSGSAGCNRYSASVQIDGLRVAFGPAAASKRYCAAPDGVMAVESRFLAALARVASAHADGDALELRDAADATVVALSRAAAD